jgi:hypothetical protein
MDRLFLDRGSVFLITENEKGSVETLQEHQTDAFFNTAFPIQILDANNKKLLSKYPPLCRKGLVLSR